MIDNTERAGTEPAQTDDRAPTSLVDTGDLDADDGSDVDAGSVDTRQDRQQHHDVGDGDGSAYFPDDSVTAGYDVSIAVDGFGGWQKADQPNLSAFLEIAREADVSQDGVTDMLRFYAENVAQAQAGNGAPGDASSYEATQ